MEKEKKKQQKTIKPGTAEELIEYLKQFPPESGINIGIFQKQGKTSFAHEVKEMTLISDAPNACIFLVVGKAKKVEMPELEYK